MFLSFFTQLHCLMLCMRIPPYCLFRNWMFSNLDNGNEMTWYVTTRSLHHPPPKTMMMKKHSSTQKTEHTEHWTPNPQTNRVHKGTWKKWNLYDKPPTRKTDITTTVITLWKSLFPATAGSQNETGGPSGLRSTYWADSAIMNSRVKNAKGSNPLRPQRESS